MKCVLMKHYISNNWLCSSNGMSVPIAEFEFPIFHPCCVHALNAKQTRLVLSIVATRFLCIPSTAPSSQQSVNYANWKTAWGFMNLSIIYRLSPAWNTKASFGAIPLVVASIKIRLTLVRFRVHPKVNRSSIHEIS